MQKEHEGFKQLDIIFVKIVILYQELDKNIDTKKVEAQYLKVIRYLTLAQVTIVFQRKVSA
jgi:hypothetical protein